VNWVEALCGPGTFALMFFSVDVTVTVHCPASVNPGARVSVPVPLLLSVKVINAPATLVRLPPVVAVRPPTTLDTVPALTATA